VKRTYEQKRRAERASETRQRIVEAAVGLHTTVGPARTTIAAIARRAGVQRHTVYAHFPSERKLFEACSSHWSALHPLPDAERERWSATGDAESRLRAALDDLYAWYEEAGDDVALFRRDARTHATTAEVLAADDARLTSLRDALLAGWPRRKAVRAAVSHALELETWQSLVQRHGLTRQQAVDAMIRFVASV
jgi:AcrR family transcriptional regulator